ncbi:hypothetical protein IQ61_44040 [Streptomyces scabiei]|nr:hypothetical protein IQ61_44040 [Streptomyces scabiei]
MRVRAGLAMRWRGRPFSERITDCADIGDRADRGRSVGAHRPTEGSVQVQEMAGDEQLAGCRAGPCVRSVPGSVARQAQPGVSSKPSWSRIRRAAAL